MNKLIGGIGATLGSAVGWWLGARGGFFMAFVVSMVGTGLGLYWGRRLAATLLP